MLTKNSVILLGTSPTAPSCHLALTPHISRHDPPGLPASLSHWPPLAVQLPHHSDRAPCSQRKRMPKPRGHVTLSTTALAPQTKGNCGRAKPQATLGARQWHHCQMIPGVLAPTGTTEDLAGTLPPPCAAASTLGS